MIRLILRRYAVIYDFCWLINLCAKTLCPFKWGSGLKDWVWEFGFRASLNPTPLKPQALGFRILGLGLWMCRDWVSKFRVDPPRPWATSVLLEKQYKHIHR